MGGQLGALLLGLSGRAPRLAALLVAFFTLNVYRRTAELLDGGNNLVQLLLVYLLLVNAGGRPLRDAWHKPFGVALSNVAFWMCRIQIAIVYLSAGIFKLNGHLWTSGMALYYVLQSETYSHPLAQQFVVRFPELAMLSVYFTLAFQFVFPTLVWIRKTRPWVLLAGVLLHLGIAFVMGLLEFGLIMCVVYVAFLPDDVSARLRGPLLDPEPLRVECPSGQPRLVALLRALASLSSRRIVLDVRGEARTLAAMSASGRSEGVEALWAALRRVPLLVPALPAALALWGVGLSGPIYARLARATQTA